MREPTSHALRACEVIQITGEDTSVKQQAEIWSLICYTIPMTNTVIIKRLVALEREVQTIKSQIQRGVVAQVKKSQKLPRGLQIALREIEEGKEIGPFNTVDEFMAG